MARARAKGAAAAGLLGAILAAGVPCAAQSPPGAAAAGADLVTLKDGSMYRGTVLELVPHDHVTLLLPSGEPRRIPMSEVLETVVAHGRPGGASPAPARSGEARAAPIRFVSATPDTVLLLRTREVEVTQVVWNGDSHESYGAVSRAYRRVCAAPCDATLPVGEDHLALSQAGREPVESEATAAIAGPATVRGAYDDRRALRIAGWVVFGASVAAGTAMILAAVEQKSGTCGSDSTGNDCIVQPSTNDALLVSGGAVLLVGTVVGVALGLQRDHASIEVTPMLQAAPAAARPEAPRPAAEGLGLRVRF